LYVLRLIFKLQNMIYKELYIIIVTAVKAPSTIFCVYITLHTLLDKVIAY